jgi:hypothetical protein
MAIALLSANPAFPQSRIIRVVTRNIAADINGVTAPLPGLIAPWTNANDVADGGALEGIGEETVAGDPARPLDILALEETTSNPITVSPICNALNTFYNRISYIVSWTYECRGLGVCLSGRITICLRNLIMSRNEINGNTSPLLLAGLVCLLSMPVVYTVTRPVIWLFSGPWVPWLLAVIFAVAPFMIAFMVLYRCAWHDDRTPGKRIFSTSLSACIIVCIDLLLTGALVMIGGFIVASSRVMGGN